jgi:hypothetical protein
MLTLSARFWAPVSPLSCSVSGKASGNSLFSVVKADLELLQGVTYNVVNPTSTITQVTDLTKLHKC